MLSLSNVDLIESLRLFKNVNLPVTFLVPTKTGMEKSIMDATHEVRDFFLRQGVHDFASQEQGEDSKILLGTKLFSKGEITDTKTSLYRPRTKSGDPRIWIYNLGNYADPTDLLAITKQNDWIVVINCSKTNLNQVLDIEKAIFKELFPNAITQISDIANELLSKLKIISGKGFVKTLRPGDTGIGYTLESLLGIEANSSRTPDYRGIEIKSGRATSQNSGRTTIFSKTPNWNISRLKGSKELLAERGRFNHNKQKSQLFHTFSTIKPNSYNMLLEIDESYDLLHQLYLEENIKQRDVTWELSVLKDRLSEKHRETFWVTAQTKGKGGSSNEEFRYSSVKHTGTIDLNAFPILLELGVITLDYTISETTNGGAKDQGYLFKIAPRDLDLLFSSIKYYSLT